MKLNIGIIGSGSASAVCLCSIFQVISINFDRIDFNDINVSIISNTNNPKISVGESLSPSLFYNLSKILKLHTISDYEKIDLTPRFGVRHKWENNENVSFDIEYTTFDENNINFNRGIAAHVSSEKFSDFIFERINLLYENKVLEIYDHIKHISQDESAALAHGENETYTFDYIFDCRGFPTKEELNSGKYNLPEFETVNSALLFQHHQEYSHPYSEALFHKNGWQFGINTRNRKAFGYLYNKDITDKEKALNHFKQLNKDIPIDNVRELYWPFYSVKKAVDGRIICMGNKLYFYEPIQGIPLHNYFTITRFIMFKILNLSELLVDDIFVKSFTDINLPFEEMINTFHNNFMKRLYDIVITNYVGNNMNSSFWKITSQKSIESLLKSESWLKFCHIYVKYKNDESIYPHFPPHPNNIIKQYIDGLNVRPEKFINGEYSVPK